jgi:transcriptional regulator with XRE-family HTH domain
VAEAVGVDRTTISSWERGTSTPHPTQRPAYADALGITLTDLDPMLSNVPPPNNRTPLWLSQYLGMEQSATEVRSHEPHVVYGLLQTPEYAAAIAGSVGVAPTPEGYVRRNIEQRQYRQARVNGGDLTIHVVQPEIPLHLRMGDPATMAAQLDRLVEMGRRPNVTLQIVPFSVGQYEALRMGSFSVMRHPWVQGLTVYHLQYGGLASIEDVDEAANFLAAFDQAAELALSPEDSLAFIEQAAEQWRTIT